MLLAAYATANDYLDLVKSGNAHFGDGNLDQAIEDYTAALRIEPNGYLALYNRGNVYYDKNNYKLAIEDYNAALKIEPDYQPALNNLDLAYKEMAKQAEKQRLFEQEQQQQEFLNRRGDEYYENGDYDQAIAYYNAALRIKPGYAPAIKNLEKVRKKLGR
jgi:tetratricopeptide (TPR) repeat protein